jgi:hypothetical protein
MSIKLTMYIYSVVWPELNRKYITKILVYLRSGFAQSCSDRPNLRPNIVALFLYTIYISGMTTVRNIITAPIVNEV